jgi:FkbM family methyltransferase
MILLLNKLHRLGLYKILSGFCSLMYIIKYLKLVRVNYHPQYRAYSFKFKHNCYMSIGPGWAYNTNYLENLLFSTYNYYYKPGPGDIVMDIGAGLGEESLIYAQLVGERGKVIAVEANPKTCEALKFAVDKNSFKQVLPVNKALYENETEIFIEDNSENYLVNTISETQVGNGFKVKAVSFNQLIEELNIEKIDFLKVNIEGAEQYLTLSMSECFKRVKNLCISCHDFRDTYHKHGSFYVTKDKIRSFLLENGFEILEREPFNRVVDDYIYARNPN